MNGAGDQIFADSAFAAQKDRGAGRRDALNGAEDLAHRVAAADDVVEFVTLAELGAQLPVFIPQSPDLERLVDDGHQVIERKRFGQKIHGAGFHGVDRRFDASEGGHDDDRRVRVLAPQVREQFQTADAGQPKIGEDDVGAVGQFERFFGAPGLFYFKTGSL